MDSFNLYDREIISIFIGGGTPSLFSPQAFTTLIAEISRLTKFSSNIEITMEANPGTLEYKNFSDYKAAGINRISLGVQSFDNEKLQALGRVHNSDNIFKAVANLDSANITNFNLDIMYGLPKQNIDEALKTVSKYRTVLGGAQRRLQSASNNLETSTVNLQAGKSQILDTDVADSAGKLASANIKKSAGIAVLSQANMAPASLQRLMILSCLICCMS
mgnify:CR=1 FL=1